MLKGVARNGVVLVSGVDDSLALFGIIIYHNSRFDVIFIDIDRVKTAENGINVSFLSNFGLVL